MVRQKITASGEPAVEEAGCVPPPVAAHGDREKGGEDRPLDSLRANWPPTLMVVGEGKDYINISPASWFFLNFSQEVFTHPVRLSFFSLNRMPSL